MAESDLSQFRQKLSPHRKQFGQSFYISIFVSVGTAIIGTEVGTSRMPIWHVLQVFLVVATLTFGVLWLFSVRWKDSEPDPS
ncbi:hypothetical protein [Aeromicrobium sp. Leaf350]|uniref:hypothetical protein n=1 Tax=Aeromicrobium sp. Leaf350 TaxID=2876565 RepID=UPI001E4CBF07|nr:hypothetical protein [Aeromicrobium sp. Leaf350]